ncbi:hypothetical protein DRW42_06970 [Pedobacter miscanthi]|uniref:Uncharacterized protein n=1 Tax=Pedobacter miscanthi TaxID=2259170 RepID=A0A366L4Y0_9SPHI|nr:hypothetical protein DRW42_06970 [Pedobacter miscanthi]
MLLPNLGVLTLPELLEIDEIKVNIESEQNQKIKKRLLFFFRQASNLVSEPKTKAKVHLPGIRTAIN